MRRCETALLGRSFALAGVALGAAGLFVMDLQVFLSGALLGGLILLRSCWLSETPCWLSAALSGWLCLLFMACVRRDDETDVSAHDVIPATWP